MFEGTEWERENLDNWVPQLTTDSMFCAGANLNYNTGVGPGDSGGPAVQRFTFFI